MHHNRTTPYKNRLLSSLPAALQANLSSRLTPVPLVLRQGLFDWNTPIEHVYFPESGMISLVRSLDDGGRAEVGIVGREGVLGLSLLSGTDISFPDAMVQMPGQSLRMTAADFRQEFEANPVFRTALLRFNEVMQSQVMQTAACNGHHELEQRLARWLLMAHDCADGLEMQLTQEFLAMMLGVHRPSLTIAAGNFQRAGIIRYTGGRVTVLQRAQLEEASCECYAAVRERRIALLGI